MYKSCISSGAATRWKFFEQTEIQDAELDHGNKVYQFKLMLLNISVTYINESLIFQLLLSYKVNNWVATEKYLRERSNL